MAGGEASFEWGERVAGSENSYERMRYRGEWYSLYDCVHIRSDREEPHVGKIMRLYEEDGQRKLRVRWFLRGNELPVAVASDLSGKNKKERFIAQGNVRGVENVNVVETILKKVTVLCTAKVPRNPQPPQHLVDDAHYYFNRVYDAQQRKLVKMDRIDKALASKLFNKPEWVVWEEIKSPTSVTDFAMVARKRLSPNAQESRGVEDTDFKKFKGGS